MGKMLSKSFLFPMDTEHVVHNVCSIKVLAFPETSVCPRAVSWEEADHAHRPLKLVMDALQDDQAWWM